MNFLSTIIFKGNHIPKYCRSWNIHIQTLEYLKLYYYLFLILNLYYYLFLRWSADKHSGNGSWSIVSVNGTSDDRKKLGTPLSKSFKLAGEAVCHDQPGQVHGAYSSGVNAANWIIDSINSDDIANDGVHRDIIIAGAGTTTTTTTNNNNNNNTNTTNYYLLIMLK